jgi:hypothetical protein
MRTSRYPNTGPATEATKRYAVERAVNDPVKLARAAAIVRAALARNGLTLAELMARIDAGDTR